LPSGPTALEKKSHPLYDMLQKRAWNDILQADDYETRKEALKQFGPIVEKVLVNPTNAPGVQPFQPRSEKGSAPWANLYVVRSAQGWHLVYWYGEVEDAAKNKTDLFLALLLFDDSGEPLKSILDRARQLVTSDPPQSEELARVLLEILDDHGPLSELLKR
jgi:hypothetical protein